MGDIEDQLGKTVEVYKITESLNDRGDVTKATPSTVNAVCEIQTMTGSEREVRTGVLRTGDAIGFFAPSENVVIGDEVSYQSVTYLVVEIFKEQIGTTGVFQEAHLQRILK